MRKKILGVLSLSALAFTAISMTSCGLTDEEIFEQNKKCVFLSSTGTNDTKPDDSDYVIISGDLRVFTAFTPEFVEKGGNVTWHSSNEDVIAIDRVNTEKAQTATVTRPDFGEDNELVTITATVSMGTFTENVVWNLSVKEMDVQSSEIASLITSVFRARIFNIVYINGQNTGRTELKEDSNGDSILAFYLDLTSYPAAQSFIGTNVTDTTSVEFYRSNGRGVNITASTDPTILTNEDVKTAILYHLTEDLKVSGKTVKEVLEAIATNRAIDGVAITTSDYNALKNSGVIEIYNYIMQTIGEDTITFA